MTWDVDTAAQDIVQPKKETRIRSEDGALDKESLMAEERAVVVSPSLLLWIHLDIVHHYLIPTEAGVCGSMTTSWT